MNLVSAPAFQHRNHKKDDDSIYSYYLLNDFYIPGTVLLL